MVRSYPIREIMTAMTGNTLGTCPYGPMGGRDDCSPAYKTKVHIPIDGGGARGCGWAGWYRVTIDRRTASAGPANREIGAK
eukprot:SAG31_NODE_1101_length_9905_cov_3.367122_5_plen_81_part_00